MAPEAADLLLVVKDLLEICRYKCSPLDEVVRSDGLSNEQIIIGAIRTIKRIEAANTSRHLTRFNTGPSSRSNAQIRRRNGGVKHQFEDDIGGCSANYR